MVIDEHTYRRLTSIRSALLGTALGAWLGLLTGLALGLFVAGAAWLTMLLGGLLIGAALGAVMGFLNHWATDGKRRAADGRRDFAGTAAMPAQRYAVEVDSAHPAEVVRAPDHR